MWRNGPQQLHAAVTLLNQGNCHLRARGRHEYDRGDKSRRIENEGKITAAVWRTVNLIVQHSYKNKRVGRVRG